MYYAVKFVYFCFFCNIGGQDYHIGTAQKMSVDIDVTPDLSLFIQRKLRIVQYRYGSRSHWRMLNTAKLLLHKWVERYELMQNFLKKRLKISASSGSFFISALRHRVASDNILSRGLMVCCVQTFRAVGTSVLSTSIQELEGRLDDVKTMCQNTTKRLPACFSGNVGSDFDKRLVCDYVTTSDILVVAVNVFHLVSK